MITNIMKKKMKKLAGIPVLPPRGWKKKVAELAGVSPKSVYNTLSGRVVGPTSHRIIEAYNRICQRSLSNE